MMYEAHCANCGISFGIPLNYRKQRVEDHETFYCPNGHKNYYPQKNEAEVLRNQLDLEIRNNERLSRNLDRSANNADYLGRSRNAFMGHLNKIKAKLQAGRCPCGNCDERFPELEKHLMESHPNFNEQASRNS